MNTGQDFVLILFPDVWGWNLWYYGVNIAVKVLKFLKQKVYLKECFYGWLARLMLKYMYAGYFFPLNI